MAATAKDLKNDDTTDAGFDLLMDDVTSPATASVGITRICVGTGTTLVRMDSSNPLYAQLTVGTAEIGNVKNSGTFATQATLQAGTAEIGKLAAGVAEIGNVKNSGTFAVQVDGAALTALQLIDDAIYADDADWVDGTSKHMLGGGIYQSSPQTITDGDTGPFQVDASGNLKIVNANIVSTANSSETPLAGGATFTGTSEDISSYASITVQVYASHASATDGLSMEISTDGTNWDETHTATIAATTPREFVLPAHANYFRVVYTNGGTLQTAFRLQAILHTQPVPSAAHALDDNQAADDYAVLTKSALIAQAAGSGDFVPVQATSSGNLKASIEEFDAGLTGPGVEASALLVTLATDSTGVLSVDDNGGSLTVDGTVTANLSTTDNTVLDNIQTAVEIIDNSVYVDDADWTALTSSHGLIGGVYQSTPGTITDGDTGPIRLDANGAIHINDGGNSITVDGTVTANPASGTIDTVTTVGTVSSVTAVAGTVTVDGSGVTQPVSVADGAITAGASSIVHPIDTAVGGTDYGVAMLAKHKEDQIHLTTADDDYDILALDSLGSLHVNAEAHHIFDELSATTGWTALGNDTLNLATTAKHVMGTAALTFDKVNGAANTVFAAIQKTLSSTDLGDVSPHDILQTSLYIPDLTDVNYAFVRLGTDSTNYNEWRLDATVLTAATFETAALAIGDADYTGITGNGMNSSAITYVALGVAFNTETDTLAGIIFDQVSYHTNQHTSTSINSEVTSSVSSANVNINKVGNKVVNTQAGNVSTGTQRITIASDDVNLAAIKTAVEGTLTVGSHAVTNAGTFPVQISDTSFAVADGNALGEGVLIQGDDGTDRKNINVDATTGDVQVDITHTVTVDGSGVTQPVSGTVTANLSATDNAVLDTIDAVLDTINAKLVTGTVIGDVNLGATDNAVLDSIVTNTTGLAGTVSGSELQVDVVASLPAGTNAIGKLAANSGVDIGDVDVTSISAGTNLVGDVGISGARTSGGTTLYKNIDVDESEDQVKGSAGQVYWIHAINLSAAVKYLKLYDATAASVVVGTTVPDLTFPIPTQGDTNGAGFTITIPNGVAFSTAITVAATTGVADNDAGAPGANEVVLNMGYA